MANVKQQVPTDAEKAAVWDAYRKRQPTRVPVVLSTNPRVALADPAWNPDGYTFEQAATDPLIHVQVSLQHQLHRRTCLHHFTDDPTTLPDVWNVDLNVYNVYEAACLGAPIEYRAGQVPDTHPIYAGGNRAALFEVDIDHPLESPFCRYYLDFWHEMEKICKDFRFQGRPVKLQPWALCGTDGPVTVACNLIGSEFLMELAAEPDEADRVLAFLTRATINRRNAFYAYWGDRIGRGNGFADDSVATLSTRMYAERILPHHRAWLEAGPAGPRGCHLCGDATRHFPTIARELGVTTFDTGFPVDHGGLRRELGPEIELLGGPQVSLLLQGTPEQVFERARGILQSGVMAGGRFILREGNNLPPLCPPANLEAMYQACLAYGRY